MAIPSEFYVSEIRRTALLTGILMAVIVSAAWLLSTVLISRVVAEITVLRERMKTVSSGDLTVRYQVRSKDEIGQIGQTFNRMVERKFDESAAALWVPRFILQPVVENAIVHRLPEDLSRQGCI